MPTLYENHKQSVEEHRNDPAYKIHADREKGALEDAVNHLNLTCLQLSQYSTLIDRNTPTFKIAEIVEVCDHKLTVARDQVRAVRRAAKIVSARREREERGVFRA